MVTTLPKAPLALGLAGLLPQIASLGVLLALPDWRWLAVSAACFYAATILSFLGGTWWMIGLVTGSREAAPYIWGVVAPLIGWASLLPWSLGWAWPGPSLVVLGIALFASPFVDLALSRLAPLPRGWVALRWVLAAGLGALTAIIGALA